MPRVIWKGSISFGLVTIPVQLFSAVSRKNVRFNQLDARGPSGWPGAPPAGRVAASTGDLESDATGLR